MVNIHSVHTNWKDLCPACGLRVYMEVCTRSAFALFMLTRKPCTRPRMIGVCARSILALFTGKQKPYNPLPACKLHGPWRPMLECYRVYVVYYTGVSYMCVSCKGTTAQVNSCPHSLHFSSPVLPFPHPFSFQWSFFHSILLYNFQGIFPFLRNVLLPSLPILPLAIYPIIMFPSTIFFHHSSSSVH